MTLTSATRGSTSSFMVEDATGFCNFFFGTAQKGELANAVALALSKTSQHRNQIGLRRKSQGDEPHGSPLCFLRQKQRPISAAGAPIVSSDLYRVSPITYHL